MHSKLEHRQPLRLTLPDLTIGSQPVSEGTSWSWPTRDETPPQGAVVETTRKVAETPATATYPRQSSGIANKDGAAHVGSRETDSMKYINATPHTLHVYDMDSEEAVLELPKSHIVIRLGERFVRLDDTALHGHQIPMHGCSYGDLKAQDHDGNAVEVPEPQDDVFYVVALPVALAAPARTDFLVCGPPVRDDGRMVGCRGLTVPHYTV
jgi:hypothetical protein